MNDVANDPDNQVWLTTRETCERLAEAGLPISRSALYGWREQGLLAWRKHGRDWRILAASVDAYTDVQKAANAREYFEAHDRMRDTTTGKQRSADSAKIDLQVEVIAVNHHKEDPNCDQVWVDCGGRGTWQLVMNTSSPWADVHKQIIEALHEMVADVTITLYWTRDAIRDWSAA